MYSLILGTQTLIVLSNDVAIKELLDKRGGIHSDRLEMYIGQTLCSGGYRFLMLVSIVTRLEGTKFLTNMDGRGTGITGEW